MSRRLIKTQSNKEKSLAAKEKASFQIRKSIAFVYAADNNISWHGKRKH